MPNTKSAIRRVRRVKKIKSKIKVTMIHGTKKEKPKRSFGEIIERRKI